MFNWQILPTIGPSWQNYHTWLCWLYPLMLMLLDFKVPWGPSTNKKYCNLLKCLKYRNARFVQDHAPRILRKNLLKCLRYILIQDYEGKVQYKGFLPRLNTLIQEFTSPCQGWAAMYSLLCSLSFMQQEV